MSFVFRNCLHFKVIWPNPSSSISFIVQCCSLPVDSTTTTPGMVGSYCALLPTAAVCVCILSFTCDLWFKGGNEVCFVPLPNGRPLRVILLSFVAISRNNCCEQKVCCEIAMHDLCYNNNFVNVVFSISTISTASGTCWKAEGQPASETREKMENEKRIMSVGTEVYPD